MSAAANEHRLSKRADGGTHWLHRMVRPLLVEATDCNGEQSGRSEHGKSLVNQRGTRPAIVAGMKDKITCRFCGETVAARNGKHEYKPLLYAHKCPHGCDCMGGRRRGKGRNWAVLVLGNKDVDGCRKCYEWQLTQLKRPN